MATHVHGHMRMTVRAVPLSHRELEFLAERYRALRRAGTPVAIMAAQATVSIASMLAIGLVFLAIGAPLWLAALFGVVTASAPAIVTWREHRRARDHRLLEEAA